VNVAGRSGAGALICFSFATQATVGHADITPRTKFSQRLAIIEAMMGQFHGSSLLTYLLRAHTGILAI
jgi:hypothetical protein